MNDCINRPKKVFDFLKENTKTIPIILYPGEHYTVGEQHDSQLSIEKLNHDFEQLLANPRLIKGKLVGISELEQKAKSFTQNLRSNYGIYVSFLKPAKIYLTDYDKSFILSVKDGLQEQEIRKEQCDISLSSESLNYCFRFPWGNDTLGINGRYQRPQNGNYSHFYNFFRFDQLKSRGIHPGLSYFVIMLVRKAMVKTGLMKV